MAIKIVMCLLNNFMSFDFGDEIIKDNFLRRQMAITNHSINSNTHETNQSKNGKNKPE